ncbi:endo-1,4-beta-xylanase [Kitasatospora sp. NPDC059571]|uniref:endo-1,4-beta-xylanase n=1 Tax=Kitasatospora sp. NPDC059571 TaxID=3346871 RepID=UPI0036D198B7
MRMLGRRRLAAAAAATAVLGLLGTASPAGAADANSLRALAEAKSRYFGTALTQDNLNNSTLTAVAAAQFDMVTPGNEMKWDTVEASRGSFNFGPGDRILAFAQANGQRVRGHNLVWHSQLPSWVSSLPAAQVPTAMTDHITAEVTHYKGKLYAWDVVNEPFNEDGSYRQDAFTAGYGSGPAYIAAALTAAHAADPAAKLYLNDYNIEGLGAKSDAMYNLVKSLKAQGTPIDGVGLESHFIVGQVPSSLQANMQRFADLGVDVAVTELDDRTTVPASSSALTTQANEYAAVVKACLAVTRCVGVSQWGVGDADSWIPSAFSGYGAATMYDQGYQPKPAYTATQQALGGTGTGGGGTGGGGTGGGGTGACAAAFSFDQQWQGGFNGKVTVTAGSAAITSWKVTLTLAPGQQLSGLWSGSVTWDAAHTVMTVASTYNGSLAAGASTSFGFTVQSNGNTAAPTVGGCTAS